MGDGEIFQTSPTTITMFHRATKLEYLKGTSLELTFQDGKIIRYDLAQLFDKYPGLKALKKRELFTSGKMTAYGIRWNDDLDIEAETVYENGVLIRTRKTSVAEKVAIAIKTARQKSGLSQVELAELTGIDQGDISKIECGFANPSISTLERIANALKKELTIKVV